MKLVVFSAILLSHWILLASCGKHGQESPLRSQSPWVWTCRQSRCVREERQVNAASSGSLAACKLTCNSFSSLWPKPRGSMTTTNKLVSFGIDQLSEIAISAPSSQSEILVREAADLFHNRLRQIAPSAAPVSEDEPIRLEISISSNETALTTATDESYFLSLDVGNSSPKIRLTATTFFGARHGLETLSQLIEFDETINQFIIVANATISDSPAFSHRGLLIDTSRNYIKISTLKRIIDAMSYDKLNVLHWHMTDTHSFPFVSKREPLLSQYGAYFPSQVYREEDIASLVHYAKVRGVKIVPEFDAPAHVGSGWEWGERHGLGNLTLCFNKEPWQDYCVEPPCGQLNPINDNVYKILHNIYRDMADVFQSDIFHMGGDEVHMRCWNETSEIRDWLSKRGFSDDDKSYLHLWSYFQNRSLNELDRAYNTTQPVVLWTSGLTEEGHADQYLDPNRYIIQIWTKGDDQQIADLYRKGFPLIMSNYDAWYFDCGYGAWVGDAPNNWCSPYIGWQKAYANSPRKLITDFDLEFDRRRVLGGEAAMWSEQVDSATIEGKLWPRASALAERLWTDPDSDWKSAENRMMHHRQRLVQRGIMADALQPEWCHQHEGSCVL